jgi:response regulator of citrate/malate metabolism
VTFSVVIVEDEPEIADLLKVCVSENRWLRPAGAARTREQAIAMIRCVSPDLVLLDFGLPDAANGGFDVWHVLQDLDPQPDVIAVTNASEMTTVDKARKHGAFAYVVKPFTPAVMADKLADYAHFRRLMRELSARLDQAAIDQQFGRPQRPSRLPAGLDRERLRSIVRVLQTAGAPLLASEVGDRVGVSRETANRYLNYLHEKVGMADRTAVIQGPGHPAFLYQLAPRWRSAVVG